MSRFFFFSGILSRCRRRRTERAFMFKEKGAGGGLMMKMSFSTYVTSYCWENVRVQGRDRGHQILRDLKGPLAPANRAVCAYLRSVRIPLLQLDWSRDVEQRRGQLIKGSKISNVCCATLLRFYICSSRLMLDKRSGDKERDKRWQVPWRIWSTPF